MHKSGVLKSFNTPTEVIDFLYKEDKTKEELKQLKIFKEKFIEIFYNKKNIIIKDISKKIFK
jgi:hypothetical protein